jgi:hypothetical protein
MNTEISDGAVFHSYTKLGTEALIDCLKEVSKDKKNTSIEQTMLVGGWVCW